MSRQISSRKYAQGDPPHFGAWLRQLRAARKLPLRTVAAAVEIDSTLLSKIELGQRLPTEEQTRAFAGFFKVSFKEMEARRLAERFWMDHGGSPAAKKAALLIKEQAVDYKTKKGSQE